MPLRIWFFGLLITLFGRAGVLVPSMAHASSHPKLVLQVGHSSEINCLTFSPDGKTIASGSNDQTAKLWDAQTGLLKTTLGGHSYGVFDIAFSPDGKTLATVGFRIRERYSGQAMSEVRLWNVATGKLQRAWKQPLALRFVAFSPNGKWLACGGGDGYDSGNSVETRDQSIVQIWSVSTGKKAREWGNRGGCAYLSGFPTFIAFSPNGHQIAAADEYSVSIWSMVTGKREHLFRGRRGRLVFSADGKSLAVGNAVCDARNGKMIRAYGLANANLIFSYNGHDDDNAIRFAADLQTVFAVSLGQPKSGEKDKSEGFLSYRDDPNREGAVAETGYVWLGHGKEPKVTLAPIDEYIETIALSRNGTKIACAVTSSGLGSEGGKQQIALWDATTGRQERVFGRTQTAPLERIAFSEDSRTLYVTGQTLFEWSRTTGSLKKERATKLLAVSPDGQIAAIYKNKKIALVRARTGALVCLLQDSAVEFYEGEPPNLEIHFSPDSRYVSFGADLKIRIWETRTGKVKRAVDWESAHGAGGARVAIAPAAKMVAIGHWFEGLYIQDNQSDDGWSFGDDITAKDPIPAFSPDSKTLAWADRDHLLRLWDTATHKVKVNIAGKNFPTDLAYAPDGKTIAVAGGEGKISLRDSRTGRQKRLLVGSDSAIQRIVYSRDSRTLASLDEANRIYFWNLRTGRLMATSLLVLQADQDARTRAKAITFTDKTIPFSDKAAAFSKGDWFVFTPEGYFDCSANAAKYVFWDVNGVLYPTERYWKKFRRPDLVEKSLRGEKITAPALSNDDTPPQVRFLAIQYQASSKENASNVRSNLQFVTITLEARGRHDFSQTAIELLVNGRPLAKPYSKPQGVENIAAQNSAPTLEADEKKPITLGDKAVIVGSRGVIRFGDKATKRSTPTSDKFVKRFTFKVPLPLGAADVSRKGFQDVSLRALAFDRAELGSAPATIWLRNQKARQVRSNLIALCVGVSDYRNGETLASGKKPAMGKIANLKYPDDDARDIERRLQKETGGLYDKVEVRTLIDDNATLPNLRAELKRLQDPKVVRPGQIDTVIVFLSGHGVSNAQGEYFFPAYDFDPKNPQATSLSGRELQSSLGSAVPARSVFLFVDSCHSGALSTLAGGERGAANGDDLSFAVKDSGVYLLASSGALQTSLESNAWNHGAFTEAILNSLKAKVKDGVIHFDELTYLLPDELVKALRAAKLDERAMSPVVPMEGRYLEKPVARTEP